MNIVSDDAGDAAGRRSVEEFLRPLLGLDRLQHSRLGGFESGGKTYSLPRFTFVGPNSADPIRVGLFGVIHGDEPAGAYALAEFLRQLADDPGAAEHFELQIYPICNPTGFEDNTRHSRSGRDLNREFWTNSSEPEVRILEAELQREHFSGIVQLHADDTSEGIYGFVKGHTLTEHLLRPALREAGKVLPRNVNATIDGFAARDGIIHDRYEGVLAPPARIDPVPFEIVFETPHAAPLDLQVRALVVAIRVILSEYRQLIAFAANI
ncbi:MAG TPA: succinylglutamate desuccinylase/aspartoacylase family protein [Verrucomicrobiae bacterium]|nr:succinylglutamate desuccinylase/aspartoacylase family protein [Verrucomicrobiae bacterium]